MRRFLYACLAGGLVACGPALAGKPGRGAGLDPTDDFFKSARAHGANHATPGAPLDRATLARLMRSGGATRPAARSGGVAQLRARDRGVHPLFRRATTRERALGELGWRQRGSAAGLKDRFDAIGTAMKASVFGSGLADNVSVDLDSSPEIEFHFEFD